MSAKKQTKQDLLINAIMSNKKIDKIVELLNDGAKPNTSDTYGRLPLTTAVQFRKPNMVELLLKRGADPNRNNSEALWHAITIDHNDILQMLIDAGINVNVKDFKGVPMIHKVESVSKINLLLKNGVDPNTMIGNVPYVFTLIARHQYALIEIIVSKGLNVNIKDTETGFNTIMTAAENNYDDLVEYFIKAGTDINAVNTAGENALDIAVARDNVKSVEKLVKGGIAINVNTFRRFLRDGKKPKFFELILSALTKDDLNSKDADGKPLLFDVIDSASRFGTFDIFRAFLDAGADINVKDAKGLNALFLPTVVTLPQVLNLLLSKGIDTKLEDEDGLTALFYAMRNAAKPEVIKRFIDAGLDVNHRTKSGITPFLFAILFAVNANAIQYIDLLVALGVDVNALMDNGMNAIHLLIQTPAIKQTSLRIDLLKKLVSVGVNYNALSAKGTTPLVLSILKAKENPQENTPFVLELLSLSDIDIRSPLVEKDMSPAEVAAYSALVDILDAIIAKGFNVNEKLSNGLSLLENAERGEYNYIINAFIVTEFQPDTSGLWRGYTQSDLVKLDTIFDTKRSAGRIPAANVSLCPVCHEFVFRGEACKYMYHDCRKGGHMYHKRLYNMYKTPEGYIWWCIVCGRICNGHTHYRLSSHGIKPLLEVPGPGADLFSDDCTGPERGGGLQEKIKRFIRLREVSKELNKEIGNITVNKAFKKQVEATWDAPLNISSENAAAQMISKKYTLAARNFPNAPAVFPSNLPEKPNWNKKNFPDVVRTPAEAAGFEPPKLLKGKNHGGSQNDGVDVVQFHHVRKDGSVNDHTGRYISPEYLDMWLGSMNTSYATDMFGYCWDYGQGCTARIFPDEVKPFVDEDTYTEYKRKFNWKFAEQAGGGTVDFFHHAENAVCGLPPRKSRMGGRRKTRRNKSLKKRKMTTRKR